MKNKHLVKRHSHCWGYFCAHWAFCNVSPSREIYKTILGNFHLMQKHLWYAKTFIQLPVSSNPHPLSPKVRKFPPGKLPTFQESSWRLTSPNNIQSRKSSSSPWRWLVVKGMSTPAAEVRGHVRIHTETTRVSSWLCLKSPSN